jgi:2-polyprenyl-3-methyl-5-hydroxy-6-metoxy-1,4-benzoquinol methylase
MRENRSKIAERREPALRRFDRFSIGDPLLVGKLAANSLLRCLGAKRAYGVLLVVGLRRLFVTASKPSVCIKRTTRLHEHWMPRALSTACIRRLPETAAMLQEDLLDIGAQTGIFSAMLARLSAVP